MREIGVGERYKQKQGLGIERKRDRVGREKKERKREEWEKEAKPQREIERGRQIKRDSGGREREIQGHGRNPVLTAQYI